MPVQTLCASIESMKKSGSHRFDPVRFHYIEAMAAQAAQHLESVAQLVLSKAQQSIAAYLKDFALAKEEASAMLDRNLETHPELDPVLRGYFERCEFRQMKRFNEKQLRRGGAKLLTDLCEKLSPDSATADGIGHSMPFHELLEQQERESISRYGSAELPCAIPTDVQAPELKSTRSFRGARARARADQVLKRAIKECPEDAGPLNPQRLTIESLSSMSELSPHYLNRFVEYIDTLMLLETLGKRSK